MMLSTGIIKCKNKLLFFNIEAIPPFDIGPKYANTTTKVKPTAVVAANFRI